MVALRPRCAALPNAAKSTMVPAGCVLGNLTIAHSVASGLRVGASELRLSGRSARLQVLAHTASIAISRGSV
jgi:hypothetical protein